MRLVLSILISSIFFTSCKSSFTKRHYRPGIFREHTNSINAVGQKKQNIGRGNFVSILKSKANLKLSTISTDSTNKYLQQIEKYDLGEKSIEKMLQLKHKKNVRSKIKYIKNRKEPISDQTADEKLRKASVAVAWAILVCAILFGIGFLIGGLTGYLYFAILLIFASGGIGIALILTFLILEIIRQSIVNKRVKDERIKALPNKELYRFKKNYDKLKSINWVSSIFLTIGFFTFLVTEEALQIALAWSLIIGLVVALIILIRLLIMMNEFKKYKSLLSEEETKNYKKVRNFSLVIASLFAAMMIFVAIIFALV